MVSAATSFAAAAAAITVLLLYGDAAAAVCCCMVMLLLQAAAAAVRVRGLLLDVGRHGGHDHDGAGAGGGKRLGRDACPSWLPRQQAGAAQRCCGCGAGSRPIQAWFSDKQTRTGGRATGCGKQVSGCSPGSCVLERNHTTPNRVKAGQCCGRAMHRTVIVLCGEERAGACV